MRRVQITIRALAVVLLAFGLFGCGSPYPPAPIGTSSVTHEYLIGPGDTLRIVVWHNPQVSATIPVRPDGKISTPLVQDMVAAGKTPVELAGDIKQALSKYIKDPIVTVMVTQFAGAYNQQIRVIGQATKPEALQYRKGMTLMDVMIAVGGMTPLAAGNDASIWRLVDGKRKQYSVRLDDLLNKGDMSANVAMRPGDVLVIPESTF
ncbi:MAG: polysaccharide export protein [Betaproteobacteria bacterium]|nr:polysaccharide export protein [Betaproteobacteria bacterium]